MVGKPNFEPINFLIKRVWRIAPIYWIVTTLALVFWYTSRFWKADVDRLGVLGVVKSYFAFPLQDFPLVNPGWSLEHEIIFYILAALLIPLFRLPGLFIALLALWVVGRFYTGWDYHLFSYSQIYFAAGIAAYWARYMPARITGTIAVLSLSIVCAHLYNYLSLSSSWLIIFMAIGCSSLISALVSLEYQGMTFPKWLVAIGDASYSIYIIHWILLPWIGSMAYKLGGALEIWRWAAFGICIMVGLLSRKFIEVPLMRIRITRPSSSLSRMESQKTL